MKTMATTMNPETAQENEMRTVVLNGELTVQSSHEVKEMILTQLAPNRILNLDLAEVNCVDVAGLQLLCSAHRTAQARSGDIHLNLPLPASFRDAVQAAGFERHCDCRLDRNHTCLWKFGDPK
jgi:anti-anti-sigma factor